MCVKHATHTMEIARHFNESGKVKIEHYHTTVIIEVIIVACTFHKPMEVVDVRFHIYNCLLIIYLLLVFIFYNYDVE